MDWEAGREPGSPDMVHRIGEAGQSSNPLVTTSSPQHHTHGGAAHQSPASRPALLGSSHGGTSPADRWSAEDRATSTVPSAAPSDYDNLFRTLAAAIKTKDQLTLGGFRPLGTKQARRKDQFDANQLGFLDKMLWNVLSVQEQQACERCREGRSRVYLSSLISLLRLL